MSQLADMLEAARTNGTTPYVRAREGALAADRAMAVDFFDRPKDNVAGLSLDFRTDLLEKDAAPPDLTNFKSGAVAKYADEREAHNPTPIAGGYRPLITPTPIGLVNNCTQYYPIQDSTVNQRVVLVGSSDTGIGSNTYYTAPGQEYMATITCTKTGMEGSN